MISEELQRKIEIFNICSKDNIALKKVMFSVA